MRYFNAILLMILVKATAAQVWSDTSASVFFSVQYRPSAYYYGITAIDAGVYYYNPAHLCQLSLRAGGGPTRLTTRFSEETSQSAFIKPGIYLIGNRHQKQLLGSLGLYGLYVYDRQQGTTTHPDKIWGDLVKHYAFTDHLFGAAIDFSIFYKITYRLQAVVSIQANKFIYNQNKARVYYFVPGTWWLKDINCDGGIGLIYKVNK